MEYKNLREVGDLITGTVLKRFISELDGDDVSKATLVSNVNPTATSYHNIVQAGRENSLQFKVAIPSDIWYLYKLEDDLNVYSSELEGVLIEYLNSKIGFLKIPRDKGDIDGGSSPKVCGKLRYQFISNGESFDWDIGDVSLNCVAFIDSLIGPLGVMETISLYGNVTGKPGEVIEGGKLLPPQPSAAGTSPGLAIVTKGYLPNQNTKLFAPNLEGEIVPSLRNWIRTKLFKEDTFPVPGEFLGILARPFVQFAWFMQDSSPVLVGGNWIRTGSYTSGIITVIEGDNKYSVQVEEQVIEGVESSDYLEYAVGDRVALLHSLPSKSKMAWKETLQTNSLRILPITFYKS